MSSIAFMGFGEAAKAFVSGWRSTETGSNGLPVRTFDIKVGSNIHTSQLTEDCRALDVECCMDPGEAMHGANVVFSMVTADRALEAAQSAAASIAPNTLYLDCNSCSPRTKMAAADLLSEAGVIYVDVAVMAPVHPGRHRTPLLLAGVGAPRAHAFLVGLGMNAKLAGDAVGQASSIKMLRSVMIKGFEALTTECVLAARRAGVEEAVLASLQASDPGIDWIARAAYNLERMEVHGERRAAEMVEVAATLRDLGLPDRMAAATVDWQRQIGELCLTSFEGSLVERIDRIMERLDT